MRVTIRKRGNSAAVRLPAAAMRAAQLRLDAPVKVRAEVGHVVIERLCEAQVALDTLLAGITADNMHAAVETGDPVGRKVL